jgi:SCP-2 sterol transfer family
MDTTTATPDNAQLGAVIPDLVGHAGLIGLEIDGQIVKVLRVEDGRVQLFPQTGQPLDAVVMCRSEEDFWQICSGQLDAIVAGLRGRLAIRGRDLTLAVKVIRGLETHAHQMARGKEA